MMRNIMLGFFALSILGIVFFTGQGSANTLNSSTELNKIGALKILDSTDKTMMGMNLGTTDTITSITLTFKTSIDGSTVNISLTDSDDLEIGVGSQFVSPANTVVTITLSDLITSNERDTLKNVSISIS
jgi:hypothetical protein